MILFFRILCIFSFLFSKEEREMFFLLLLTFVFSTTTAYGGSASLSSALSIKWTIDSATQTIKIDLNLTKKAWVGVGFHPVGSGGNGMTNADIVLAQFDASGNAQVDDCYTMTFEQPPTDVSQGGQDNILSFSGSQKDDITLVSFVRKLVTGDKFDSPFTIGPMNVIWAIGSSNTLGYHGYGPENRGSQILDLFDDDVCGHTTGCKSCTSHSQCVYCDTDGLCYDKTNIGSCAVTNTTCTASCSNAVPNAYVPDGYCASQWMSGLSGPRGIITASNGDILVVESGISQVSVIYPNGDGFVKSKLAGASGLNHGITIGGSFLYASSQTTVYRWKYVPGMRSDLGSPQTVISGIPCCHHVSRTLEFDAVGHLFVSCGSGSNVDPNSSRARILRFNVSSVPTGGLAWSSGFLFADGLRNEVGIRFDASGRLWGVENGVDDLNRPDLGGDIHTDNPSEEVNLFETEGKFYGYPYCWSEYQLAAPYGKGRGTQWAHPNFMNDGVHTDAWCRNTNNVVTPKWNMGAHQAPLDIYFIYDNSFPGFAPGGAFVALHGSWDRQPPQGYRVLYLSFDGGLPVKETIAFSHAGSSQNWPNNIRPVSITSKNCGTRNCLYVTSDASGHIIEIKYTG